MAGFGNQRKERPATPRQRDYLESLLRDAGYPSFADARHPLGLTQKQSNGRFTATEASALIDALLDAHRNGTDPTDGVAEAVETKRAAEAARRQAAEQERQLRGIPAELIADELRRRGWTVTEP